MATRAGTSRTGGRKTTRTPKAAAEAAEPALRVVASAVPAVAASQDGGGDDTAMAEAADGGHDDGAQGADRPGSDAYGRKDLLARVVALADVRKRDAKPVVEAVLAALAEALAEGRALNLPPLGKLSISRSRAEGGVVMLKLRRSGARKPADAPLAEADAEG